MRNLRQKVKVFITCTMLVGLANISTVSAAAKPDPGGNAMPKGDLTYEGFIQIISNLLDIPTAEPPERLFQKSAEKTAVVQFPGQIFHGVYQTYNRDFTIEPGEPTLYGKMQRTAWRSYVANRTGIITFNTYGSAIFGEVPDTVLAVYRVDTTNQLSKIVVSDNTDVAGGGKKTSFVQFAAVKGAEYAIQIGSKDETGLDVLLTGFSLPPEGGLTVQPVSPYGGYIYTCNANVGNQCQDASYVVYNATPEPLEVKATSSLGPGVVLPLPFSLAPGAAAVKTFTFPAGFGGNAAHVISGGFTFTGKANSVLKARTTVAAIVALGAVGAPAATLKIKSESKLLSGPTGTLFVYGMAVTNAGTADLSGCYVANTDPVVERVWAEYDPLTREYTSEPYAPFAIKRGKTVNIAVGIRSMRDRIADQDDSPLFGIACTSAAGFPVPGRLDLTNKVQFSSLVKKLTPITYVGSSPAAGILAVPPSGKVMTATFRNESSTAETFTIKLAERSIYPLGDPKRFPMAVCLADVLDNKCLASTAAELTLKVQAGKTFSVKVGVKSPGEAPGFSPENIGLVLTVEQPYDKSDPFSFKVPISGFSKALKRL